jgi:DNA polymerase III subunit delta'
MLRSIDIIEQHTMVWEKLRNVVEKRTLPQALLFSGPRHTNIMQFVNRFIAMLICEDNTANPCGICKNCQCLLHDTHPDLIYIKEEDAKIDNIRQLQQNIYQPAQFATKKFVVIEAADTLNMSVANALLKILEEPPKHIMFILIAEQAISVTATIRSRCQKYLFKNNENLKDSYLNLGAVYTELSPRSRLYHEKDNLQQNFKLLTQAQITPCALAKLWSEYEWEDLLWFLYLLTADLIKNMSVNFTHVKIKLFSQLDLIQQYTQHIRRGINLNQTLALEALLIGYIGCN